MSIQFLRGTRTKIKSSEVVPKAGQPLYATDIHKLYVGDGTTPAKDLKGIVGVDDAFEVNTSTGELVLKINIADDNVQLSESQALYNTITIDGPVNSWGHVMSTFYDSLFDSISGSNKVLISDRSIDANLGSNMDMITESEEPINWVTAINNKLGSDGVSIMPNSLAIDLYNSSRKDLVSYTTYGLLRDQALGLETGLTMPIDKVFNDVSDIVTSSNVIIFAVNWPENLQYNSEEGIENNYIALDCANAVINLINHNTNYKVILSIHCTNDTLYTTIATDIINYISSQTSVNGISTDTDNVFIEIEGDANRLFVLNPIKNESNFVQLLPVQLSDSAFIFYDDSTNDFNTAVLNNLNVFNENRYNIYITNRLYQCYNLIQTTESSFSLVINDKTQFMKMLQANAFDKFDKIILGTELALSMLHAIHHVSSFSQTVFDQLLDVDVCNNFLTRMQQSNKSVYYAMDVQYVKGYEADTTTITTINKITVKQSETY